MFVKALTLIVILASGPLAAQQPHFDGRARQLEYPGPGREQAEPTDLTEVRIGYFGPSDASHPLGGDMWLAAQLAVEEANSAGGYRNLPFRLLPAWSESPWKAGIRDVTRLVYEDKVWALVGGIDGPSTHLAEQVTTKSRLALVNPGSTDKTVNYAYVPWMFSMPPADHLQAPALCAALEKALTGGNRRFAVISATDHDSQLATVAFKSLFAKRGMSPFRHVQLRNNSQELTEVVQEIAASKPDVVLLVANAIDSAQLVRALRKVGSEARIFGSCTLGRRIFRETAGYEAEGTVFPLLENKSGEYERFAQRFSSRFGYAPDFAATETYDAVRLVIGAVRAAGLNRALIRDAIRNLSGWEGANGIVKWDTVGQNTRPVRLGMYRGGRIELVN